MLRSLYNRVIALAGSRRAGLWLAVVSFAESSFFPIPPDALLVPMVLARPDRAWRLAFVCTTASVAGGALGYLIGYALFDVLAAPILSFYHYDATFQAFKARYADWWIWVILIKGFIPIIPYKIITIASGVLKFDFLLFMFASIITRGARFFVVAALLRRYGEPVRAFIEQRLTLITTAVAASFVAVLLVLKFL